MTMGRECQTRRMESFETKTIQVALNGQARGIPAGLTLDRLLLFLEMDPSRVAVELNRAIVRKPDWQATGVMDGDQLEIVWFVGGG